MQPAFLLRTTLNPDETRFNFSIFDNPVLDLLTSDEAVKVCSKMMHIYTRLRRAPAKLFDSSGVLLIHGDGTLTAYEILCKLTGVAPATLTKAIAWMKKQKVIGYWAGKNKTGIRIFFNVAAGSIKPNQQKNLRLVPTSFDALRTSANEAAFNESFAFKSIQDSDKRASARDDESPAATEPELRDLPLFAALEDSVTPPLPPDLPPPTAPAATSDQAAPRTPTKPHLTLVPPVQATTETRLAVLDVVVRRMEQLEQAVAALPSLEWLAEVLETKFIPKAIRVALAEMYRRQNSTRGKPGHDPGGSAPVIDLAVLEAEARAEEWAKEALRALSPTEYNTRFAEFEQRARSDPQYSKLHEWTDEAKRSHFEMLLKRELLTNYQPSERDS